MSTAPASQKKLVAIVVTHNRLKQLKVTVSRLLEGPKTELHAIIVVDNASNDGTAEWLAHQEDSRLAVTTMRRNLGGAGGFEAGMRYATQRYTAEWLLLLDDDARPERDALTLFHTSNYDSFDGVAAAVHHPDGRICETNRPSLNPFWHISRFRKTILGQGRDGFHLSAQDFESEALQPIDIASFVGFFVRSDVVRRRGYPDPAMFIYADDSLYTLGLTKLGHRLVFDPNIRFEHDYSTTSQTNRAFKPLWKCYYYHRNLLFLYRDAAGIFFWPALLIVLPRWALKVRDHRGNGRAFWAYMLRAVWHGLTRRTDIAHEIVITWGGSGAQN